MECIWGSPCRLDFSYASGAVQSSARPATAMTLAIVSAVFVVAFNGIITLAVSWASRYGRCVLKDGFAWHVEPGEVMLLLHSEPDKATLPSKRLVRITGGKQDRVVTHIRRACWL